MARGEVRYRLALETKAFTDGIKAAKQEAASLGNDLAGKLGKAGNILSAMGPAGMVAAAGIGAATVAVGAVTAAVVSAAKAAADYADNLAALETKTGLSTDALQQMEIAAKLGNSSIESLAAATNKMQKGIVDGNENFKKLGLSLADLRKMTPEEQLKATAKAIEGIRDPAQKTAAAMAIFGKSGTDVIGSLKSLADGSAEMAGALDQNAIRASAAMADQLDLMGVAMDRAWRQFGAAVASSPEIQAAIGDITQAFVDLAVWLQKNGPEIKAFFGILAEGAREGIRLVRDLVGWFGKLNPGLGMLGGLARAAGGDWYDDKRKAANRGSGVSSGGVTISGGPRFGGAGDDAAAKAAAAAAERARAAWQSAAEKARTEWDKFYAEFEKRGREAVWGMEDDLKKRVKAMAPTGNEPDGPIAKLKAYNAMLAAVSEDAKKVDAYEAEHSLRADERLLRKIDLVGQLGASFQDLGAIVGGVFGGIIGGLGNITQGIGSAMASIRQMKTAGGGLGGMLGKASGALGLAGAAFSIGKTIFGGIKSFFGGKSDEEKAAEKQKIEDTTKQLDDLKKKIDSIRLEKLSAGVAGLASLFRHMVGQAALTPEAIDRINVKMGKYKDKLKDLTLTEDEYKKKIKERRQELESAAEGADVEQMKQRMGRLGIIGTAMFQALKKEGKSTVEAMREMGPAIDQAIAAAQAHGIEIGGTLGMLADFRQKVGANEDLVSAAEGLGSVMDALRATGSLTQETFNALQGELGTVFADLTAKGFTADQALALLAPTLLQIRDAAKEGKIAVDEQTAALIRQAEAGGHFDGVKDPMKEMVELQKMMLELWAAIAQMQGVTLPDSLRAYIATLREASAAAAGVGVPGTAPVDAHQEGHSGPDGSTQSAGGFWNPSMPHGPLAGGGTNLVVHPGEEVSVTPRGRKGGGMGNVVLNVDGRAFARVQNNNTRKNRGGARSQGQRFIGSR
jgi:hypothetical protein